MDSGRPSAFSFAVENSRPLRPIFQAGMGRPDFRPSGLVPDGTAGTCCVRLFFPGGTGKAEWSDLVFLRIVGAALREPDSGLSFPDQCEGKEDARFGGVDGFWLQSGERILQRVLFRVSGPALSPGLVPGSPFYIRSDPVLSWRRDECVGGQHSHPPEKMRTGTVFDPPRRDVPTCLLSELFRRAHGVGRIRFDGLVSPGPLFFRLDAGQPHPPSPGPPPVV